MKASEIEILKDIIQDELNSPKDIQSVYDTIETQFKQHSHLINFLAKKDRQYRESYYLRAEKTWFGLFQFTMAKALMVVAVIAAGFVVMSPGIFTMDRFCSFIFGASFYFLMLHLLTLFKFRKHKKFLEQINQRYKKELEDSLQELDKH